VEREANPYGIAVVGRTLDVLEALGAHRPPTLTELSRLVGATKGATFRILANLQARGYVERDAETGRYRLGLKLVQLGSQAAQGRDLRTMARPALEALQADSGETVALGVPATDGVTYIDVVERPHGLRTSAEIGRREPYHATALGKAVAAHWPELETQLEVLVSQAGLTKRTAKTVVSPRTLRRELEETRARGYAIEDEESEIGVRAVAAPVADHGGVVIGAVSVAGPTSRLTPSRLASLGPRVAAAAKQIAARMGAA